MAAWRFMLILCILCASAQPSPRRRSSPPRRRYSPPRRRYDDRRRYDPPRRRYDDRRRYDPPRRRYVPPVVCAPHCTFCIMSGTCETCVTGYTRLVPSLQCAACASHCLRCDSAGPASCDATGCIQGYTNVAGKCLACSSHCEQCDRSGPANCDPGQCARGYGNSGTGCGACTSHCQSCSTAGANNCNKGSCVARYTNDRNLCSACGSSCSTCGISGPGRCDRCDDGHFVDRTKSCQRCTQNCRQCRDGTLQGCTDCYSGYGFDKDRHCVEQTPSTGWWMSIIGGVLACLTCGGCFLCRKRSVREASMRQPLAASAALSSAASGMSLPTVAPPVAPVADPGRQSSQSSPPSGSWRGYYTYDRVNHDVCEFQLRFENTTVQGEGVDDVGCYTIRGTYKSAQKSVTFAKKYRLGSRNHLGLLNEDNEGHVVTYQGRLVGDTLGAGFRGTWQIRNSGTNSNGNFHLWPAMESWASAPPLEALAPSQQLFQVAEDGECVICFERAISTCLRPCGHIAMCSQCVNRLPLPRTCPICRSRIESVLTRSGEQGPSASQALRAA
ncbi:unnamed protein product [Effrenium voratum]|nr:unnamed protein product [Effrenium voratum]